eukprot:1594827-Prymnesium_polylepis.1
MEADHPARRLRVSEWRLAGSPESNDGQRAELSTTGSIAPSLVVVVVARPVGTAYDQYDAQCGGSGRYALPAVPCVQLYVVWEGATRARPHHVRSPDGAKRA